MKIWVALATLLFSVSAWADKGAGAVLAKDADTYTAATGGKVEYHLKAGTIFGFFTFTGGWGEHKQKNGFYRVAFFADNSGGDEKTTWVKEENLAFFYWECTPSKTEGWLTSETACIPVEGISRQWRLEFKMGASEKCKELGIKALKGSVFAEPVAPPPVRPLARPTAPVGPPAMPTTPAGPSAMPPTDMGPSAGPTTPVGPPAMPTTHMGPSTVPSTHMGPQPTPTAPVEKTSP